MRSTPYNVHVLSRSGWAMRFTTRLRLAPDGQCIIGLVSDSDRTHYAVGSSPGVTERSDGIPRVGEIVTRLKGIQQAQPPAHHFQVPHDFRILDSARPAVPHL